MNPISIVKQASRLVWANKYLWFFGFFIAGAGGAGGSGHPKQAPGGAHAAHALPTWLWPVLLVAAVVGLVAILLHVVSEAALIEGIQRRKADEPWGVGVGLRGGLRHFWRVLSVKLLAALVVFVAVALIVAPVLLAVLKLMPLWAGIPLAVLAAMVGVPLVLTGYLAYEYALRFAVLEGAPAVDAFRAALSFLHGRLVPSIVLMVTSSASAIVAGLAGLVVAIPGALVGVAVYFAAGLVPAIVAGAVLFVPLLVPIIGALGTFRSAVWTIGFLDARPAA